MFGAAACPQLDPCAQNFCCVVYYVVKPTNVKSWDYLARLVLEIWKRQCCVSYSGSADIGHGMFSVRNFLITNPKIINAVMRYFNVLWPDRSIPSALWWGIFSSESDCRTWKFYTSELPYNGSTLEWSHLRLGDRRLQVHFLIGKRVHYVEISGQNRNRK